MTGDENDWADLRDPETARRVLWDKHRQYLQASARVRELEAEVAKLTGDRDNWREMFYLRVELTDLAMRAVLEQDELNCDLRDEVHRAERRAERAVR